MKGKNGNYENVYIKVIQVNPSAFCSFLLQKKVKRKGKNIHKRRKGYKGEKNT